MISVIIGAGIGAVSSVPVTNVLLAGQVENHTLQQTQIDRNFGRPGNMSGARGESAPSDISGNAVNTADGDRNNQFNKMFGNATAYITEVNSAMNLTVVLQMLCVGMLLTLAASMAAVLFIMRYDPLKILANRD